MFRRFLIWLVMAAACYGVVRATSYGFMPVSTSDTVEWRLVDVAPNTSILDLSDRLQSLGLIRSKVCFLAAARMSGESDHIQPGQYQLSPNMTPVEIVEKLVKGQVATEWVVVPEGSTVRQIEQILSGHGLAHVARFDTALRQNERSYRRELHLRQGSLEGYLFPDTYHFPKTMPETAIVRQMVERFKQVVLNDQYDKIHESNTGLDLSHTMILASLVEKEAQHDEERSHIAGVLLNRLRNGARLQCDAAIEYALPEHKAHLSPADLRIPSPYNTYLHAGLPPTPICCPGLASIQAALRPMATHDLYYVAEPDGYHLFSPTLAEHDKNIQKVKQMTDERQG